jgi:hypothetical protein
MPLGKFTPFEAARDGAGTQCLMSPEFVPKVQKMHLFSRKRRIVGRTEGGSMNRTASRLTTRRGKLDELDIHLLTHLEERQDRLYAILSKATHYRNILGDEIKRLRAGSAPEMSRPLVAQWDHLRREIKQLAQEL